VNNFTQPSIAKYFLRWITKIAPGAFTIADNCPAPLRTFLTGLPSPRHKQMACVVLEKIANRTAYEEQDRDTLLNWMLAYPELDRRADAILSQKTAPKTFVELLDKVYRSEIREVNQLVTEFLKAQIEE
jgi:hypothetical protein